MLLNRVKNTFRIIAFLEGVSYLLLLFVAVPIKYNLGDPTYVKLLGMPHGLLFVGYIVFSYLLKDDENWNGKDFGIVMLASVLPFGTFYVDWKYLRN
jgi:integral membrane protein